MLNINELESRWLRYKIKSYIPYLTISISLFVIFVIVIIYFDKDQNQKSKNLVINENNNTSIEESETIPKLESISLKRTQKIEKPITPKKIELINESIDEQRTLIPSMDFIKEMQSSSQPYYDNNDKLNPNNQTNEEIHQSIQNTSLKDKVDDIVEEIVLENTVETEKKDEIVAEEATKKISIHRQNVQSDINGIIKRFKKNNNPALSLFIAKKYYELGDYHNAYNYALITNGINRDIEASWIVFSKSLVKLGKKEMAIKTLEDYIKQTQSYSAKILLDEILSGKFE